VIYDDHVIGGGSIRIKVDADTRQDDRRSAPGFLLFEMFLSICLKAFRFRHVVRSVICLLSSVYTDRKVPALCR
jgi:hypothetical protein